MTGEEKQRMRERLSVFTNVSPGQEVVQFFTLGTGEQGVVLVDKVVLNLLDAAERADKNERGDD